MPSPRIGESILGGRPQSIQLHTGPHIQSQKQIAPFSSPKAIQQTSDQQASYAQLNEVLKYPVNPAYLGGELQNQQSSPQTFLDYCREQNIPFNKADSMLYDINKAQQNYEIFKVLFDQMTVNKPLVDAQKNDLPIKLPNGKLHLGWPSRMDTPQEMIRDFKEGRRHPILLSPSKSKHFPQSKESTQNVAEYAYLRSPLTARLSNNDLLTSISLAGSSSRLLQKKGSSRKLEDNQSLIAKQYEAFTKLRNQKAQQLLKVFDDPIQREAELARIQQVLNPSLDSLGQTLIQGKVVNQDDSVVKIMNTCRLAHKKS